MNIENNKIIAEFMGKKEIITENQFLAMEHKAHNPTIIEYLKYDTDWNWLMEVVEKINATTNYTLVIQSMGCYVCDVNSGKHITNPTGNWQPDEIIKSVYEVIVEFIKWYNSQNSAK